MMEVVELPSVDYCDNNSQTTTSTSNSNHQINGDLLPSSFYKQSSSPQTPIAKAQLEDYLNANDAGLRCQMTTRAPSGGGERSDDGGTSRWNEQTGQLTLSGDDVMLEVEGRMAEMREKRSRLQLDVEDNAGQENGFLVDSSDEDRENIGLVPRSSFHRVASTPLVTMSTPRRTVEKPKTSCSSPMGVGPSFLAITSALCRVYNPDDFDQLGYLGEGFFSDVYLVRHKASGESMVLKKGKEFYATSSFDAPNNTAKAPTNGGLTTVFYSPPSSSAQQQSPYRQPHKWAMIREVQLMNKLSHRNVLAFKGVCVELSLGRWNIHSLTEYCDSGSLYRLILDRDRPLPWTRRACLAQEVANGMNYVHDKGFMHRDLTSMNVLLQKVGHYYRALISDFGLACAIPAVDATTKLPQAGTPYWMAPECLREDKYDEKADVFSFGVILCQLVARVDADPDQGFPRTALFGLDYVAFSRLCDDDTPTKFLKLAFSCCLMDPRSRPSFAVIIKEAYATLHAVRTYAKQRAQRAAHAHAASVRAKWVEIARALSRSNSAAAILAAAPFPQPPLSLAPPEDEGASPLNRTAPTSRFSPTMEEVTVEGTLTKNGTTEENNEQLTTLTVAKSVAAEDPYYEPSHANPFATHARYRNGRLKIPPPPTPHRKQRRYLISRCDGVVSGCSACGGGGGDRRIVTPRRTTPRVTIDTRTLTAPFARLRLVDAISAVRPDTSVCQECSGRLMVVAGRDCPDGGVTAVSTGGSQSLPSSPTFHRRRDSSCSFPTPSSVASSQCVNDGQTSAASLDLLSAAGSECSGGGRGSVGPTPAKERRELQGRLISKFSESDARYASLHDPRRRQTLMTPTQTPTDTPTSNTSTSNTTTSSRQTIGSFCSIPLVRSPSLANTDTPPSAEANSTNDQLNITCSTSSTGNTSSTADNEPELRDGSAYSDVFNTPAAVTTTQPGLSVKMGLPTVVQMDQGTSRDSGKVSSIAGIATACVSGGTHGAAGQSRVRRAVDGSVGRCRLL